MDFKALKHFTIFGEKGLTIDLLKGLWRKVAVKVHPDKGGSHELYLEAQDEYQSLLTYVNAGFTAQSDTVESYKDFMGFMAGVSPVVKDCIRAVNFIKGIRAVEITGYWVWVTLLKTDVTERGLLKEIKMLDIDGIERKFQWHRKECKWVWKGMPAKGRKGMNWEDKKEYWGHSQFQKDEALG